MLVISFRTLIQEAMAPPGEKRLSGNIRSTEQLLKTESLSLLEQQHRGPFAFLAFHPEADRPITEYIQQGSLASDSGPNILALFTLSGEATFPTRLTPSSFGDWLEIDSSSHPSYQLIRFLFEPEPVPPLPG